MNQVKADALAMAVARLFKQSGCTAGERLFVTARLFHVATKRLFPIADDESRQLAWNELDAAYKFLGGLLQQETRH